MSCIVNIYFFIKNMYFIYVLYTAKYSLNAYMCDISVKHKMYLWVTLYYFYFT